MLIVACLLLIVPCIHNDLFGKFLSQIRSRVNPPQFATTSPHPCLFSATRISLAAIDAGDYFFSCPCGSGALPWTQREGGPLALEFDACRAPLTRMIDYSTLTVSAIGGEGGLRVQSRSSS